MIAPVTAVPDRVTEDLDRYEILKDVIDECIDIALNHRQSGHPGGSRSKVHLLLATLLSGAMRWDARDPTRRYADRFVLSAGHTVPVVYATLAVLNEGLRARHELDGDARFAFPSDGRWALTWEDMLTLRRHGGLPGHPEMAGKSLFLKANTGPSGHGMPFAAGEALAVRLAGAEEVKVFVLEGEGGLTAGAAHETKNTAWGLGLSNLVFLVDWNDFGIDARAHSSVVYGEPEDWFRPHGWRVVGTNQGMEWEPVMRTVLDAARRDDAASVPTVAWFRTRKGRGYGKFDAASHGSAHRTNSPEFWANRRTFMERYGVTYDGFEEAAATDEAAGSAQAASHLRTAMSVLRRDESLVRWLGDRLVEIGASVPDEIPGAVLSNRTARIFDDARITDVRSYPPEMFRKPGERQPNRAALGAWGSWINAWARAEYGRPLFVVCSADLAESTNIAGFGADWGSMPGYGWFDRTANPRGVVIPQQITEFTNAGLVAGLASVNFADDPTLAFDGFWGACSTYASFSYLKYGPIRLFSQMAQDSELKLGKILWVAGHSGPETADDSRTHFGIFETGVTQLFPEGSVIDLHPWEYNEVPAVLAAALATDVPIVALHLTRPSIEIPDREALGMPSHFAAARGAYVLRDFKPGRRQMGTVFVRGTLPTANVVSLLPELDRAGLDVKIVAAISPQLFRRQDPVYQASTITDADRWDSMVITNGAFRLMRDWVDGPVAADYSLSADWDDRWRTGGNLEEIIAEAHLDPDRILSAIERFVSERDSRVQKLRAAVEAVARR